MNREEILKQFSKTEDKLFIAKILDKIKFVRTKNQIQVTDFLDTYQQSMVEKLLSNFSEQQGMLYGGYEEAERKILFLYPTKLQTIFQQDKNQNVVIKETIKVLSIILPPELYGNYTHRDYLSGIMKLGIKREKIGDIVVNDTGAEILVHVDMISYLLTHLKDLTRFQKAEIKENEIADLKITPVQKEEQVILIPQQRLDVIVSEILHLSRSKANEIISQERVFVNHELKIKNATNVKQGDILTIRGKGKFEIGEVISQTAKGKIRLQIWKYV